MSSNPYVTKVELGVELDKQNQKIDLKVNSLGLGVNGSIDTTVDTTSLPDGLYRAQITGTYTNAGNIVVKEGYYTLLRKEGGVWKLESEVKMPTLSPTGKVEEGNTEAVSGGEVFKNTTDAYSIFKRERINLINPDKIEIGYLSNGVFSPNPSYKTTGFIECKNGDIVRVTSGLNWAVYDKDFKLVDKIVGFNFYKFTVNHLDAKYLRIDNPIGTENWMLVINRLLPTSFVPYDDYPLSFNNESKSGKVINEQIENQNKVKELHINLFDKSAISVGYLNEIGDVVHHTNYYTSDFIEVNYNDVVAGGFGGYCFYDENKNFVSKHYVPGASSFIVDDASVKYIRIDNQAVNLLEQMITIGFKEHPYYIPYERTQYSFESSDAWCYSWLTSKNRGKRWLTLGDSICNGVPNGYRQQTTIQLDLININHAKDGATIGYFTDGARVISDYIDTITDDADIITVHAMVNDCSGGLPIGTFSDTTNRTFYGAYKMLSEKLLNKFTGKKIAFMTGIQRVGNTALKPYVDVIKEVGAFYGIPVLDLNANCGLYPDLQSYRKYYDDIGLHPNLEGHKIITPKVVDFINSL